MLGRPASCNHALRGRQDATFAEAVDYRIVGFAASPIAGDFGGDGRIDLATGNTSATVSVLLNNGDATFAGALNYTTACIPSSLGTSGVLARRGAACGPSCPGEARDGMMAPGSFSSSPVHRQHRVQQPPKREHDHRTTHTPARLLQLAPWCRQPEGDGTSRPQSTLPPAIDHRSNRRPIWNRPLSTKAAFNSTGPLSDGRLDETHDPSQPAAATIPPMNRALTAATITSPHFVSRNHHDELRAHLIQFTIVDRD